MPRLSALMASTYNVGTSMIALRQWVNLRAGTLGKLVFDKNGML